MPYMKLQTNVAIDDPDQLMKKASSLLSTELGKPESYIMLKVEPLSRMMFAGSVESTAFVELKSIGLTERQTTRLSGAVCAFLDDELGIAPGRVYIEFSGADGAMWGWDRRTFG